QALAEIRRIYFNTTRQTIQNDLAHAIELLKSLPTEEEREKAAVYMDGLAQMRSDRARREKGQGKQAKARPSKAPKKPCDIRALDFGLQTSGPIPALLAPYRDERVASGR